MKLFARSVFTFLLLFCTGAVSQSLSPFVCGDGKCEEVEKNRCAQDCGASPGGGRCGDGTCDFYENRDQNCPLDCNLTDTAGSGNYNEGSKSRYVPGADVDALKKQLEALKAAPADGRQETKKTPSGPSVCGDGQCDDAEKDRCGLDCGASTGRCGDGTCDSYEARDRECPVDCELTNTQSAEGTNEQPSSETHFVPRSEFESLQKQIEDLKTSPPPPEPAKKPSGPSVCGDGQCDDKEKGRCDRDCGSGPSS